MKEIDKDDYYGSRMLPHTAIEYAIEAGEQVQSIVFDKGVVTVLGIPCIIEDYHNCDAMGCGQAHVLLVARVNGFSVEVDTPTIIMIPDDELRATVVSENTQWLKPLVTVKDEPFDRVFAAKLGRMLKNPDCTCQAIGCPPGECPTCVVLT